MGERNNYDAADPVTGRLHGFDFLEKWQVNSSVADVVDQVEGVHYDLGRPPLYIVEGGVVTVNLGDPTKIDMSAVRARSGDKSIVHAGTVALALPNIAPAAENYVVIRWVKSESKPRINPLTGTAFNSMRYDSAEIIVRDGLGSVLADDVILACCVIRGVGIGDYSIMTDYPAHRAWDLGGATGNAPLVGDENLLQNTDFLCTNSTLFAGWIRYPDSWTLSLGAPTRSVPTAAAAGMTACLELQLANNQGIETIPRNDIQERLHAAGGGTFLVGLRKHAGTGSDKVKIEVLAMLGGPAKASVELDVQRFNELAWIALPFTMNPALAGDYIVLAITNQFVGASAARFYLHEPKLVRGWKKPFPSRYAFSSAQMLGFTNGTGAVLAGRVPGWGGTINWPVPFNCYATRIIVYAGTPAGAGAATDFTLYKNGMSTGFTCSLPAGASSAQNFSNSIFFSKGDLVGMNAAGLNMPSNVSISVELQPIVN